MPSETKRLHALLSGAGAASTAAIRGGCRVVRGQILEDARRIAGHITRSGGQDWMLASGDACDFAACVLAVALSGARLLVPQNSRPGALQVILSELPQARLLEPQAIDGPSHPDLPADLGRARVVFYTSGSVGEPRGHERPISALLAEVDSLEETFGREMANCEVIGTVPHHFIYGALFRVLWPLLAGRCFDADPSADIVALRGRTARARCALVSSPSFLERHAVEWPSGDDAPHVIFSSGSPLASAAAGSIQSAGARLFEVYGSTETGGIAWREGGEDGWRPLPGVSISAHADQGLHLRSSHACPGVSRSPDRVEFLPDGTFRLLGRVDRVAKVEGRRVSLDALEQIALTHPAVAAAAFFPMLEGGRLAAVIVPRWESASLEFDDLVAGIESLILAGHDATILPRRWRMAPSLPVDERGKRSLSVLRAVAGLDPSDPWRALPRLVSSRRDGAGTLTLRLAVDSGHPAFAGHFPGHPILPGVLLVHWAEVLSAVVLGSSCVVRAVQNLKFNRPVFPGSELELVLGTDDVGLLFHYRRDGESCASGRLAP